MIAVSFRRRISGKSRPSFKIEKPQQYKEFARMSTPLNAGLREVKLRYGIRRLILFDGTDVPPTVWYSDREKAQFTCDVLNNLYPKILHTVEEVELNPEDLACTLW